MNEYSFEGICYDTCPTGYYPTNTTFQVLNNTTNSTEQVTAGLCKTCEEGCQSCDSLNPEMCKTCFKTHTVQKDGACKLITATPVTDPNHQDVNKMLLKLQNIDPIFLAIILCFLGLFVFVGIFAILQCREMLKSCCCGCNRGFRKNVDVRGEYHKGDKNGAFVDVVRIDRPMEEAKKLLESDDEEDHNYNNCEGSVSVSHKTDMSGYLVNLTTHIKHDIPSNDEEE